MLVRTFSGIVIDSLLITNLMWSNIFKLFFKHVFIELNMILIANYRCLQVVKLKIIILQVNTGINLN